MRNLEDLARVGYIIENMDSVEPLLDNGEQVYSSEFNTKENVPAPLAMIKKKINGTYYCAVVATDAGYRKLWIQSAFINKKGELTQVPNDELSLSSTPEAPLPSRSPIDSITDPEQKVKENFEKSLSAYGFSEELIAEAEKKFLAGEKLTYEEARVMSELGAHMSEEVLGNERFIERVVREDASLAEKIMGKLHDLMDAFKSLTSREARAEYKRLQQAEKLYLDAVEHAGLRYVEGQILKALAMDDEDEQEEQREDSGGISYSLKSFSQQIDDVLSGADTTSTHLKVMETPKLLQEAGLPDLPIMLTAKHLKTISGKKREGKANYHDLDIAIIKQLPKYITAPVLIADSFTQEDSIVIITEAVDSKNCPVIAAIKLEGYAQENGKYIKANILASAYGKENFQSFLDRIAETDSTIYWDKAKSQDMAVNLGVQFPNIISNLDSNTIIRKARAFVKINEKKSDGKISYSLKQNKPAIAEQQTADSAKKQSEYQEAVDLDLLNFVDSVSAMENKNAVSKRKYSLGKISQTHAQLVQDILSAELNLDIDLKDYTVNIDGSAISHIDIKHGKNGKSDHSMKDKKDVARVGWAANNAEKAHIALTQSGKVDYDTQYKNKDGTPSPKIVLEKNIGDGSFIVVECVPDSDSKKIHIISARKTKSDNGQVLNVESKDSPQPTSETLLDGIAANDSIREKSKIVKGNHKNNSGNVSYSLKTDRASTTRKIKANATENNKRIYTKADSQKIINSAVSDILNFGDQNGSIYGKANDEAVDLLWHGLNTAEPGKQMGVALNVARFIIQNAVVSQVVDEQKNAHYKRVIDILQHYRRRLDLSGIKAELSKHYGKDNRNFIIPRLPS